MVGGQDDAPRRNAMTTSELLWTPPKDALVKTRIGAFMRFVEDRHGLSLQGSYDRLWNWSVTELAAFWTAVWDHFDVMAHAAPRRALGEARMPGATWFPGARLNYAENVLRMPGIPDDGPVVLAYSQ